VPDWLARAGLYHFRHDPAMATRGVALETQEAAPPGASKSGRLGQRGLRLVATHMGAEDRLHLLRMSPAHRVAPRLRGAERAQMDII
jgi:hypothetical protein